MISQLELKGVELREVVYLFVKCIVCLGYLERCKRFLRGKVERSERIYDDSFPPSKKLCF